MSIEAMTVVLNHSKAKGTEKLILLGIANHHGDQGAWPSVSTLAHYSNMSDRRVQQVIKALEESGELRVEMGKGAGVGKYKTNRYWINVTCPPNCTGFPQHSHAKPASPLESQTKPASLQDEAGFALEVKPATYKPIEEPVIEPKYSFKQKNEKATRIPEMFAPSEKAWQDMEEHFPHVDLKLETHAFRDYWSARTGQGALKKDWDATWRNWIREAHKRMAPQQIKAMEEMKREEELRRLLDEDGD